MCDMVEIFDASLKNTHRVYKNHKSPVLFSVLVISKNEETMHNSYEQKDSLGTYILWNISHDIRSENKAKLTSVPEHRFIWVHQIDFENQSSGFVPKVHPRSWSPEFIPEFVPKGYK